MVLNSPDMSMPNARDGLQVFKRSSTLSEVFGERARSSFEVCSSLGARRLLVDLPRCSTPSPFQARLPPDPFSTVLIAFGTPRCTFLALRSQSLPALHSSDPTNRRRKSFLSLPLVQVCRACSVAL